MSAHDDTVALHGWTAVPVDCNAILNGKPYINKPTPLLVKDINLPLDDPIVAHVHAYAKEKFSLQTFNHSMRVYYFSMAILRQQFPDYPLSPSTLAITSLLHDIGTTPTHLRATQLSFEFYGGILALNLLQSDPLNAPQSQAEAVAEAIIRHQDIGTVGNITFLGQIIQLATLYDNIGGNPEIVHKETRDDVNREFPRGGWAECFVGVIREELGLKPWAHTTHLGKKEFEEGVLGNELMRGYK
ncbi:hypothetical protein GE09DRAFT_1168455 [Coniochaeta sp. 2T2.1]|nr:hypothetical protein GE09DRAFT_1168455 [Coniochaeta sp. 2T2.1]